MSEFENLAATFQATQDALLKHSARAVDSALVVRNWLFGWYLVEFENAAAGRSEIYGKELINKLSNRLKEKGMKGISPTNLRKFREFFQAYSEIQQTASVKSFDGPGSTLFIETSVPNEKIQRSLSVESFQSLQQSTIAQIASSLPLGWSHYVELLTLDDTAERRFYEIGAADLIKNPLVLEFLGLEDRFYRESETLPNVLQSVTQNFILIFGVR